MKLSGSALAAFSIITFAACSGTFFGAHGVEYLENRKLSQDSVEHGASALLKEQHQEVQKEAQKIETRILSISQRVNNQVQTSSFQMKYRDDLVNFCFNLGYNVEVVTNDILDPKHPKCKNQRQAENILEIMKLICESARRLDQELQPPKLGAPPDEVIENIILTENLMAMTIGLSHKTLCRREK